MEHNMHIKIENTAHLTADEQVAARLLGQQQSFFRDLDHAEAEMRGWFGWSRGWFVHRGGGHVALHRVDGDNLRVAIVTG